MSSSKPEKRYALLIATGANSSGETDKKFKCAINDAKFLREVLIDAKRCAYNSEQVTILTGEDASRGNILAEINKLAEETDEESTVFIFFSGHARREAKGKTILFPHGYKDGIQGTHYAINISTIYDELWKMKARKLLLLNISYTPSSVRPSEMEGESWLKILLLNEEQINRLKNGRCGFAIITSSLANEVSYNGYLDNEKHSAFAIGIARALSGSGENGDRAVYVTDLRNKCFKFVEGKTNNRQHPKFKGDDFPIANYHGPLSGTESALGNNFVVKEPRADDPKPPVPQLSIVNYNNTQGGGINAAPIYNSGGQSTINFGARMG